MASHQFHFVTRWRFQAPAEAVFALLNCPLAFPEWWGAFFQQAEVLEKGDEQGVDGLIRFKIKSSIPTGLIWRYRTLSVIPGRRINVRISGDFNGDAQWLLEQDGVNTDVVFEWNVDGERKLLKEFWRSSIKTNHRAGMEQGRIALERALLAAKAEATSAIKHKAPKPAAEAKVKGHAAGR